MVGQTSKARPRLTSATAETTAIEDAAREMEQRQIRRVLVSGADNAIVGIVSIGDIAAKSNQHGLSAEERSFGRFSRMIALPALVDGDATRAEYVAGVLKITMPKKPEAKPRRIQVAAG